MKTLGVKAFFIMVGLVLLSGCAGMNGHFGCDTTAGSSCIPVSQVNASADAGVFDDRRTGGRLPWLSSKWLDDSTQARGYQGVFPISDVPVRTQERLQRIWIAPYQDVDHNYHGSSDVYTVLEKSRWLGVPPKEVNTTEAEGGMSHHAND